MSLASELAAHLAAAQGYTVGTNLFADEMPDGNVMGILLRETGGPAAALPPAWTEKTIQVLVRSPRLNHDDGWNIAGAIFEEYRAASNFDLTTWHVNWSQALQPPYCLGRNEKGMWEWSFNFIFNLRGA